MVYQQNGSGWGSFQGKTKEQRRREDLQRKVNELDASVKDQSKAILSRKTIREADYNAIVAQKDRLDKDARELEKLKRQLERMNDNGK